MTPEQFAWREVESAARLAAEARSRLADVRSLAEQAERAPHYDLAAAAASDAQLATLRVGHCLGAVRLCRQGVMRGGVGNAALAECEVDITRCLEEARALARRAMESAARLAELATDRMLDGATA